MPGVQPLFRTLIALSDTDQAKTGPAIGSPFPSTISYAAKISRGPASIEGSSEAMASMCATKSPAWPGGPQAGDVPGSRFEGSWPAGHSRRRQHPGWRAAKHAVKPASRPFGFGRLQAVLALDPEWPEAGQGFVHAVFARATYIPPVGPNVSFWKPPASASNWVTSPSCGSTRASPKERSSIT